MIQDTEMQVFSNFNASCHLSSLLFLAFRKKCCKEDSRICLLVHLCNDFFKVILCAKYYVNEKGVVIASLY